MNSILLKRKMKTITLEKYRQIFGFPVKEYYINLGFDLEKEPFEICGLEFINEYEKRRYEAELYPEVASLLCKLQNIGISHSILSAQHQTLLDDLVQYYNIQHHFIQLIGLDNHYAHSKTENGLILIKKLNLKSEKILMVGDTDHDFEVAQAMGIDCFLLSHGHHSPRRLEILGAKVFHDLKDLSHFFKLM
ncbi:uncharacterized protein METZ01_LOCUS157234 [marine metagenome]|uniref:Phosphoglycolate phosphatase n=1 Tax=marine metagenome TaxID=408172 RepID=A0A382AS61_9ZZZZ